jgi:two-component system, chemotaxis family, sensor kinase CheA
LSSLASDYDKRRGIEVGANAYIVKGGFEQESFLETVESLI